MIFEGCKTSSVTNCYYISCCYIKCSCNSPYHC